MAFGRRAVGKRFAERFPGGAGEERLPGSSQRHDARGERLRKALELGGLRPPSHVVGGALAKADGADM